MNWCMRCRSVAEADTAGDRDSGTDGAGCHLRAGAALRAGLGRIRSGIRGDAAFSAPANARFADIQHYEWRKGTSGATWTSAGTSRRIEITETEHGAHTYQVRAVGSKGAGPVASVRVTVIPLAPTVPSAHQNLSVVAGASRLTLRWGPPANDGRSRLLRSEVRRRNHRDTQWGRWINVGTAQEYVFQNLRPNRSYTLQVRPINAVGAGPVAEITGIPR